MPSDLDLTLPLRPVDHGRPARSREIHNENSGAGSQTNYNQIGGSYNQQHNTENNYYIHQPVPPPEYHEVYSYTTSQPVAGYVARTELQKQMEERLRQARTAEAVRSSILVLVGIGGAGKTQLALKYIETHRKEYSAVFWIDARLQETMDRDYARIYCLLFDSKEDPASLQADIDRVVTAVKGWFGGREGRWLFVFDNADSLDDKTDPYFVDLQRYLPNGPRVDVIITTRIRIATEMTDLNAVEVGKLSSAEATNIFLRSSKLSDSTTETLAEVAHIVEELDYLALAVTLAGAYVAATPHKQVQDYLLAYRRQRKKILDRRPTEQVHRYTKSILSTWETSCAAIEKQCPEAVTLLSSFAFLHSQDIFLELFRPESSSLFEQGKGEEHGWRGVLSTNQPFEETLDEALEALCKYSLIEWRKGPEKGQGSYSMHKLVHAWGYERLSVDERKEYSVAMLELLVEAVEWCKGTPKDRLRLVSHIMANFSTLNDIRRGAGPSMDSTLDRLQGIGVFLSEIGRWSDRLMIEEFVLKERIEGLGADHVDTISAMNNLANTLGDLGQLNEAVVIMREVVEKMKRILGEEHPSTITAMSNLANTLGDLGQLNGAVEMKREVLEKRKRILGEEHPSTIAAMNNLANTLGDLGQLNEAIALLQVAAQRMKRIGFENHPYTKVLEHNLTRLTESKAKSEQGQEQRKSSLFTRMARKLRRGAS